MPPKPTCECGECRKCRHRNYMRSWYLRNREKTIAAVRRYQAEHPERTREHDRKRHDKRDPAKQKARWTVSNALRDGKLIRQSCEDCGLPPSTSGLQKVHAHHEDYSQPLAITWLCSRCHGIRHRTAFLSEADLDSVPY